MIDKINECKDAPALNIGSKLDDNFPPIRGEVTLTLRDGDGNVIKTLNHNQVVVVGRHRLARVLCGDPSVPSNEKSLNTIKVSNGAVAAGGDALNPTPVSMTDTGLFQTSAGSIYTAILPAATFNAISSTQPPTVTFTLTLTSAAVNLPVNEAGIFFGTTGPMFAHYSFPTVDLRNTSNNSLEITWQFSF